MRGKPEGPKDKNGRQMTVRPTADKPMVNFLGSLDMEEFKKALFAQDLESNYRQLLDMMMTPTFGKQPSISALCRKLNISLVDIVNLMKNYHIAEGTARMMRHLPKVMDDVGIDAQSSTKPCPRCDGQGIIKDESADEEAGTVKLTRQCPECKGTMVQRVVGDKHARDLMFETAKLTNQRGPLVAQQFNNFQPQSGLKQIMADTEDLMEP